MDICHFNIFFISFFFSRSSSSFFLLFFSFLFIFSWFLIFLFLITSSFDVRFLICLILWLTHSIDYVEVVPDNQIYLFFLHIFLRIMLDSMRENLYFHWPVCTSTGALRMVMRSVFLLFHFYSANIQHCLGLIYFACNLI